MESTALTSADAKNILVLIARANITGQEAETVTAIQKKLVAMVAPEDKPSEALNEKTDD